MTTQGPPKYHPFSDYIEAYESFRRFTAEALIDFAAKASASPKNLIIANFSAGAIQRLDSIIRLWEAGHHDDCWILHRALVDRYVHLKSLVDNDDFEEFERWSFQRQHSNTEVALSLPTTRAKFPAEFLKKAREARRARQAIIDSDTSSNWNRPNAQDVLKGHNLSEVYVVGYNFASTRVHPMADDGQQAFIGLTTQAVAPTGDSILVLHNSFAIALLIVQEWLQSSDFQWRRFVETFYTQILEFLESGSNNYQTTCANALQLGQDVSWCEPKGEASA